MRTVSEKLRIVNNFLDWSTPPVDVIGIAGDLGIRVYRAPWPNNVAGKIQKDTKRGGESGYAIFVNEHDRGVRQRFTIAHEIAHYVLHENAIGDGIFDDALYRSGLSNRKEIEANKLAADILMPWHLLKEYEHLYSDVPAMAELFDVSEQAMSIRLNVYA